jgi:hypothetical protein
MEEALENIKEAIAGCLESLEEERTGLQESFAWLPPEARRRPPPPGGAPAGGAGEGLPGGALEQSLAFICFFWIDTREYFRPARRDL